MSNGVLRLLYRSIPTPHAIAKRALVCALLFGSSAGQADERFIVPVHDEARETNALRSSAEGVREHGGWAGSEGQLKPKRDLVYLVPAV